MEEVRILGSQGDGAGVGAIIGQELELQDLYNMVSLNYRKTRSAWQDSVRLQGCADMKLLDLESRWVSLADRLRSTEEKIRLIRDGKIDTALVINQIGLEGTARSSNST